MIYNVLNLQIVLGFGNYLLWTPEVAAAPGGMWLATYAWWGFLAGSVQAMMKEKRGTSLSPCPLQLCLLQQSKPLAQSGLPDGLGYCKVSPHNCSLSVRALMLPPLSPSNLRKISEGNIVSLFCPLKKFPILKPIGMKLKARWNAKEKSNESQRISTDIEHVHQHRRIVYSGWQGKQHNKAWRNQTTKYRLRAAKNSLQIKHKSGVQIKRLKRNAGFEITGGSLSNAKNSVSIWELWDVNLIERLKAEEFDDRICIFENEFLWPVDRLC